MGRDPKVVRARDCATKMRAQYGLITRQQALDLGLAGSWIDRRVRRGDWRTKYPGVFVSKESTRTVEQDRLAVLLWAGSENGALSHTTAAAVFGWAKTWDVHLTTTRHLETDEAWIHKVPELGKVTSRKGFNVVCPEEALVGYAAVWGDDDPDRIESALYQAVREGQTTAKAVAEHLAAKAERGRQGVPLLRKLIADGTLPHRSVLESRTFEQLSRGNFLRPESLYKIKDGDKIVAEADFAWPDRKLIVEVDGFLFHSSPRALQIDRERQNRLVVLGWTVLRYTWRQVNETPAQMLADVGRFLPRVLTLTAG